MIETTCSSRTRRSGGATQRPVGRRLEEGGELTELAGRIPDLVYRGYTAEGAGGSRWNYVGIWRASASYITGAQSLKVGYIGRLSDTEDKQFSTFNLKYRCSGHVWQAAVLMRAR